MKDINIVGDATMMKAMTLLIVLSFKSDEMAIINDDLKRPSTSMSGTHQW